MAASAASAARMTVTTASLLKSSRSLRGVQRRSLRSMQMSRLCGSLVHHRESSRHSLTWTSSQTIGQKLELNSRSFGCRSSTRATFSGREQRTGRLFAPGHAAAVVAAPPPLRQGVSPDVARELGYEVVKEESIAEYKANATLFRHTKTGAEIVSVKTDDENKVFGIVFRTPPADSTGVPHILEHSVLCGSRKYPVKEPFVELIKGSLHTFLNAFTYPDRTCYPVASTNLKDFYNLVDVYLDAVFFPNCVNDPQIFEQEGWHYELNDINDDIIFKGVVFNEMKGVYSQPDNVFYRVAQQSLFPNNTYGVDSGGEPSVIPNLTFEQFKEFHGKFYHPSNSRVWFYGDDDEEQRLRKMSEYLDKFDANPASVKESTVAVQPLFRQPLKMVETFAVGEGEAEAEEVTKKKQHIVAVNWLLAESRLPLQEELTLEFLDYLLLGTPAAPLRKALLESGLGEALMGGGLENDLSQPSFSIGLKGVAADDTGKVEKLIFDTLEGIEKDGFTDEAVESAMNTIEFSLRENNTGSFPRGLSLMLRSVSTWLYGGDPFDRLKFAEPLEQLKKQLKEEGGSRSVFMPLLRQFLLDNTHRVTIEMQPDPEKGKKEEAEEKTRLAAVKSSLVPAELEEMKQRTEALKQKQETPDSPELLKVVPVLSLSDIPKAPITIPLAKGEVADAMLLTHDLTTNNVLYADLAFDMGGLSIDLLPLVPLFCQSLLEMGTAELDFVRLNQLIGRKTGGISVSPLISAVRGKKEPVCRLVVRGKAMEGQVEDLFELMRMVLQDVQLTDQGRFKQFVAQTKQRMEAGVLGRGHSIAASRLDAMDHAAGKLSELVGGLSYLEFIRGLEKRVESDWPAVEAALQSIRAALLARSGAILNLTADERLLTRAEKAAAAVLPAFPLTAAGRGGSAAAISSMPELLVKRNEALLVPTQVNYVGKAANLYESGYELHGSAHVVSKHIGITWLWDRVRVSGGAYGGFCDFDSYSGMFTYLSYRDPNLLKTVDVYDKSAEFLRELEVDDDTLTRAIIGTISDIDSYQLPDAKGYTSLVRYLLGITEEDREKRREEILSTGPRHFKEFAEAVDGVRTKGTVVVVASPSAVEAAQQQQPNFFSPIKVL